MDAFDKVIEREQKACDDEIKALEAKFEADKIATENVHVTNITNKFI